MREMCKKTRENWLKGQEKIILSDEDKF
jgi:hypothetical protein